jgi:hypothetical protein
MPTERISNLIKTSQWWLCAGLFQRDPFPQAKAFLIYKNSANQVMNVFHDSFGTQKKGGFGCGTRKIFPQYPLLLVPNARVCIPDLFQVKWFAPVAALKKPLRHPTCFGR